MSQPLNEDQKRALADAFHAENRVRLKEDGQTTRRYRGAWYVTYTLENTMPIEIPAGALTADQAEAFTEWQDGWQLQQAFRERISKPVSRGLRTFYQNPESVEGFR